MGNGFGAHVSARRESSKYMDHLRKMKGESGAQRRTASRVGLPGIRINNIVTLGGAIRNFLDDRRDRKLSDHTTGMYRSNLKSLTDALGAERDVRTVTIEDLRAVMRTEQDRLSSKSLKTKRQCIRTFFTWLADEELIVHDPSVRLARIEVHSKKIKPLTVDEVQALLDATDKATATGARDRLLIALLADTGARVSEIITVELKNIDLENRRIVSTVKGGDEEFLNLHQKTVQELRRFIRHHVDGPGWDSIYLFRNRDGGHITRQAAYLIVKSAAERAAVPNAHPHNIRRSFATAYADDGGDLFALQRELHHHDVRTTMRYITLQDRQVAEKHQRIGLGAKLNLRNKRPPNSTPRHPATE